MIGRWGARAKWLTPGLGIKRWLLLMAAGGLLFSAGISLLVSVRFLTEFDTAVFRLEGWIRRITGTEISPALVGLAAASLGALVVALGLRGAFRSIERVLFPGGAQTLFEALRRQRLRGLRIVALGGGTGLATLLRGLKLRSSNLTAVVTVFDDGGSSGRLRRELGVLPPGDIRNCLVALAESEPLMTRLFEHRFDGGALAGHAFGNLFIASLTGVTGDLESAVREASKVLNIRGRVLPTTHGDVVLAAEMADGRTVEGESAITAAGGEIRRVYLRPGDAAPLPEALRAITRAHLILLGPGSLYTSVIPNLLVGGVAEAIRASGAVRIYVCNVMTQPGETDGYTAADHARAIIEHAGPGLFTHVIVNTQTPQSHALLERYRFQGSAPVVPALAELEAMGLTPVGLPMMSEDEMLRHDPVRLAAGVLAIARKAYPGSLRVRRWGASALRGGAMRTAGLAARRMRVVRRSRPGPGSAA